jgi:hypothetical protein
MQQPGALSEGRSEEYSGVQSSWWQVGREHQHQNMTALASQTSSTLTFLPADQFYYLSAFWGAILKVCLPSTESYSIHRKHISEEPASGEWFVLTVDTSENSTAKQVI